MSLFVQCIITIKVMLMHDPFQRVVHQERKSILPAVEQSRRKKCIGGNKKTGIAFAIPASLNQLLFVDFTFDHLALFNTCGINWA